MYAVVHYAHTKNCFSNNFFFFISLFSFFFLSFFFFFFFWGGGGGGGGGEGQYSFIPKLRFPPKLPD